MQTRSCHSVCGKENVVITPRLVSSASTATNCSRNGGLFLRQSVLLLLLPLLLLTMCLPASAVSVLKSLTIAKPVIFGIGTTTGTVTLSATSSTATSVVLKSGDANVHVPATVSVNAGALTATFTISTVAAFTAPAIVTISGAAGGWLQSAVISGVPAAYMVSIQNLGASAGNGCILLSWQDLEDGAYRGYNIYKMTGTTATKLNATPQTAPLYAITGLTNGTTYQYEVSVVNASGTESARSAIVSAIPSATIEKLTWSLPPTTATGQVALFASTPLNTVTGTILLIDGAQAGGGGASDPNAGQSGKVETDIDTTNLTNGTHTFQLYGYVGNNVCATATQSILVTNDFGGFSLDEMFLQDKGAVSSIKTTFPSGTTQWTLQVINSSNTVIRTWSGTTTSTQVSWDGTDATGVVQANGDYAVQLTALDAQSHQKQTKKHMALVKGEPNALALIQKTSAHLSDDQTLADTISAQLKIMQGNNAGFTYVVLPTTKFADKRTRRAIRNWMGTTVTDFYLFGHGCSALDGLPPIGYWGGANFWAGTFPVNSSIYQDSLKAPELHIIVSQVTKGRQYNFAMMDVCGSAGSDGNGNPANPADQTFALAFNIGSDLNFATAFVGWDGAAGLNTFPDGTTSTWRIWREQFWIALAKGYTVPSAVDQATTHTNGPLAVVNPWDGPSPAPGNYPTTRAQIIGDVDLCRIYRH